MRGREIGAIGSSSGGGIYEVSFVYNTNLDGYTTLMSDIPKLDDMALRR